MERYDIAIIGTGPAGLEAAITARIRNKKIILFGNKNLSLKVEKAHTIQNYLGLPNIGGEELKAAYEAHLKAMEIEITEDRINAVYAMGEYFALQGNGTNYEAQTVILATGVSTAKAYPGEEQFLGRGVSYCATCDAPLYRGKRQRLSVFLRRRKQKPTLWQRWQTKFIIFQCMKPMSMWQIPSKFCGKSQWLSRER